jgi:hypothetical protein
VAAGQHGKPRPDEGQQRQQCPEDSPSFGLVEYHCAAERTPAQACTASIFGIAP